MHFKQIELAGFKSFADKIDIKFDSGITAIVGPNGCGKSNVADAIRWVLGEQSSKQLRGSSMQDVIFNGTKKRKSLSYCEATLIFNNQDRFFDYDYDEVAVTRKLYRSGESEYLINKQQSRLKDIINLFYDSGIGRDGYSIIGQGKVEEIISSKPESRRVIFEEAAGIAKYKSRKVEAERKLDRTRDNLTRLRDIIFELEKQLGPLKKQAETAKKYLELKAELKDQEVNTYIYQFENANETKLKISTKLNAINEELSLRENEYNSVNEDYEQNMTEIDQVDAKINRLHQKILVLTVELEKQSGESKLVKERISYLTEQNQRIEIDIEKQKSSLELDEKSKQIKEEKISLLKKQNEQNEVNIKNLSEKLSELLTELDFVEGQAAKDTKSIIDSVEKITDIKSAVSGLKAEREILQVSKQEHIERLKLLQVKIEENQENQNKLKLQGANAQKQSEQYQKDQANFNFKLQSLTNQLREEEQNKTNLFAKSQVYENRKRLLAEMQAEFEGYSHSVKKLLKESEKNSFLKSKMVGVLANLIKVPQKYETAIEVALGAAVQNIVTFDEQGAKELINHLKKNEYGRATFLPISTMKPRWLSAEEHSASKMTGSFGVASELISYDKSISSVIENLLGATIIVDNLDTAINLANKTKYGIKIVTLDGDVVNPQGSYTGGSKKSDSVNLISREREIETLAKEIEKIKIEHTQSIDKVKELSQEIKNVTKQIEDLNVLKSQADIILAKENEKLYSAENALNISMQDRLDSQNKLKTIELKLEQINQELIVLSDMEKGSFVVSANSYSEKDKERLEKVNTLRSKRDELTSQLTSAKINFASSETEISSLNEDIARLSQNIVSTQIILESNIKLLSKNAEVLSGANEILTQALQDSANKPILKELKQAKDEQELLAQSKISMQSTIKQLNETRNTLLDNISSLKEKKYQQDMYLAKVDTDIVAMQERIYEEYELTYQTCLELKKDDFDLNLGLTETNRLKREINKLGYVNVNAIEDSKEVLSRFEMLSGQESDLVKAEDDLIEIIGDLSKEMETRFKTEFDKINDNFKVTFKELFGGGSASLELLDPDNLLESGVEIIAEPPGKNLKSITLLSGGEKALTAIAILFAILRMRPMPFCLLDEIEAALDESNVERFAQYLRKFSGNTQFIVITHRKPTMELADSLYGVTMEEEGVSRMVSVKLSDAIKNVENAEVS